MRRYSKQILLLLVVLLGGGGLLFQREIGLRYRVGQASAGLPALARTSTLDRRLFVDTTCGAAGSVTRYATDQPWDAVIAFYESYTHPLPWQGGRWNADALDYYWPFPGDDLQELRLNVALDRGSPYIIPTLLATYNSAIAPQNKAREPAQTIYLVQVAYAEDKTVSEYECARRHSFDPLSAFVPRLWQCVQSLATLGRCVGLEPQAGRSIVP
ncbi:MAG: hypothetical protein ACJ8CR_19010 [Roseiflexaceae bacterium]